MWCFTVDFSCLIILVMIFWCSSKHDPFVKDYAFFTAYRTTDYGYTRMTIHNKTHISIEQVSVDKVSGTSTTVTTFYLLCCKEHTCFTFLKFFNHTITITTLFSLKNMSRQKLLSSSVIQYKAMEVEFIRSRKC